MNLRRFGFCRAIRAPRPALTIMIRQSPDGTYEIARKPWPPIDQRSPDRTLGAGGLTHRSYVVEYVRRMLRDFEQEQAREKEGQS